MACCKRCAGAQPAATRRGEPFATVPIIGANPNTDRPAGSGIALDAKGFVLTGAAAGMSRPLETSGPGIFAISDVRSGSIKRVAASVSEARRGR